MEGYRLELSLGPPGGEWGVADDNSPREREHESLLSLGYFSKNPSFLHLQQGAVILKDASQACNSRLGLQSAENKAFSAKITANSPQKRTAPAPVVGWPPIRSFRKNIASGSSSKLSSESPPDKGPTKVTGGPKPADNGPRARFVKINMDGVPIGRKVDLKTYDSYDKLTYAVDELFRDLLAAQRESCTSGMKDECKAIGCLLDGSGEYTLVYEDNEGDKMLVGDVPWHMFVSTVKRLRVLKSSELTTLSRGSKEEKFFLDSA